ncbi:hypothetical protein V8E55_005305 [Tylopilus felleus]
MELNGEVHHPNSESPVDEEDEFVLEIACLGDDDEPASVDNKAEQAPAHTQSTELDGEGPATEDVFSIHPNVLDILEEKREEWKTSKKADQKMCWKHIHKKQAFQLGQQWSAWTVIAETQITNLTRIRNEMAGRSNDIKFYQLALNQLMKGIMAEDLKKAEWTAVEWNLRSSPEEAQARFANKNVPKFIQQFAEQMWRKGGIRLAILSGWKNQDGEIFSQKYDFNACFADRAPFESLNEVQQDWDDYFVTAFEQQKAEEPSGDIANPEDSNKGGLKSKPKS